MYSVNLTTGIAGLLIWECKVIVKEKAVAPGREKETTTPQSSMTNTEKQYSQGLTVELEETKLYPAIR